jgi:HemY protein
MSAKSMIKFGFVLTLKLSLLVAILFILVRLPGHSVLNYYGYSIELNTGLLVGGAIVFFILFHKILMLWKWMRKLPTRFKKRRMERRVNKSTELVIEAFNTIAAGDSKQALILLNKARQLNKDDVFNAIFTAQTTYNNEDDAQSEQRFRGLLKKDETRFLGYRGLVLLRTRQGKLDDAHHFLQQALQERPDSPWVLGQLFNWNVEHSSFSGAQTILEQLRIGGYLTKLEMQRKKAVLLWVKAEHCLKENNFEEFYESVIEALRLAPELTDATVALVNYYGESNRESKAWKCLKKGYSFNPHPDLLSGLKELFKQKNPLEIYQRGEELISTHPNHVTTHWLMAKLAIEAKLWGQARLHLEALRKIKLSQTFFELMAELETQENPTNFEKIQILYSQASHASRPPVWACQNCYTVLPKWYAFCPSCHSFDQIVWEEESKVKQGSVNKGFLLTKA